MQIGHQGGRHLHDDRPAGCLGSGEGRLVERFGGEGLAGDGEKGRREEEGATADHRECLNSEV